MTTPTMMLATTMTSAGTMTTMMETRTKLLTWKKKAICRPIRVQLDMNYKVYFDLRCLRKVLLANYVIFGF